jgi:hypothetical protein
MGGRCVRYGWMGGRRVRVRGVYRFSSLVKQNKKAKICFVICFAGFFFLKNLCYEVIVKQIFYKRSSNYYSYEVFRVETLRVK